MGGKKRRKKRKQKTGQTEATGRYRNPMLAVPLVGDDVEAKLDSAGLVQLRRRVVPKGGLRGFFARLLRQSYDARINLDAGGTFFWQQVDGKRTLADIARRLEKKDSITRAAAEQCAVMFVKDLMKRGLIYLKLPEGAVSEFDEATVKRLQKKLKKSSR